MTQEDLRNRLNSWRHRTPISIKGIAKLTGVSDMALGRFLNKGKGIHPATWMRLEAFLKKIESDEHNL